MTGFKTFRRSLDCRCVLAGRHWAGLPLVLALAVCAGQSALAQPQLEQIYDRVVVSSGPPDQSVNETAVAFGTSQRLVAVWNVMDEEGAHFRLGYGVSDDGGLSWTDRDNEGLLMLDDPAPPSVQADPYVVFYGRPPPSLQWFVGGGLAIGKDIGMSAFGAISDPDGFFDSSFLLPKPNTPEGSDDYSHAAVGPAPPPATETERYIYVTTVEFSYGYGLYLYKSEDGGVSWEDRKNIEVGGEWVHAEAGVPAVAGDGTLYVAYNQTYEFTRVIEGVKSADAGGSFSYLSLSQPRTFDPINWHKGAFAAGLFRIRDLLYMAIDPNDPNKIYVVYDDQTGEVDPGPPRDADLDVYLVRSLDGGANWHGPIKVNTDDPPAPPDHKKADQYMPAVTVDGFGTVHVIWYDTRRAKPELGEDEFEIDLFYAYSLDSGATFLEQNEHNLGPAIRNQDLLLPRFIGDYNSLTWRARPDEGMSVVGVYMGTGAPPTDPADETIFSTRIDFYPPGNGPLKP